MLLRRFRPAGLLVLSLPLLGACASGSSPWRGTLEGLLPGEDSSVSERAEALSFASLSLDTGDRKGLVVLGTLTGNTSYWPTGANGLVSLHQEGLHATAGLHADLLHTRYWPLETPDPQGTQARTPEPGVPDPENVSDHESYVPWREATPGAFRVTRLWRTAEGLVAGGEARGDLTCGAAIPRELPLATLTLQRCEQRLRWHDGSTTEGTLWRDAETHRLWAVSEQPWPSAPRFEWEVARAWW